MVKASELARLFESCVGKAPYPKSGSGTTSYKEIQNGSAVDCSGIFVACMKELGGKIYHGSNTIWRNYLTEKGTVTDNTSTNGYKNSHKNYNPRKSSQLKVGMAVFKWNPNTPSKFSDGLGDYQHIGLVTSVNPLRIVHSTSENNSGVVVQTKIGTFCAWGKLEGVDYDEPKNESYKEDKPMADNSSAKLKTVTSMRIRAGMGVNTKTLCVVPAGTTLPYTGNWEDGWVGVSYKGNDGYMCVTKKQYAIQVSAGSKPADDDDTPTPAKPTGSYVVVDGDKIELNADGSINVLSEAYIARLERRISELEDTVEELQEAIDSLS